MMETLLCLIASFRSLFRDRRELALENLALHQQLAILARAHPRGRLRKMDRLFWVWLSRMWKSWQESLIVVKPDTVVRWLSVDKIKSELDSGLSHGKQDDSRGLNDPPPQLGRELGLLSRLQLKYRSLRVAYVQPQLNNLFTQPFANRIDDAARPSAGMITTVLTRPAWAQPAVLPACLAQDHRACDRYDNKIHSP
jgi:hypothetical protein